MRVNFYEKRLWYEECTVRDGVQSLGVDVKLLKTIVPRISILRNICNYFSKSAHDFVFCSVQCHEIRLRRSDYFYNEFVEGQLKKFWVTEPAAYGNP